MSDTAQQTSQTASPENGLSLESQIESLLFVADGPTPIAQLATALEIKPRKITAALDNLEAGYAQRGLRLQRFKDQVQLTTAPESATIVERFLGLESVQRLTKSALEVLSIVAYQQPVTRPQIDAIRGVNSDSVLKRLHTRGLIEEVGRAEGPGRAILYGTTPEFLQHFGLKSLDELPPLNPEEMLAEAESTATDDDGANVDAEAAPAGESSAPESQSPRIAPDPARSSVLAAAYRDAPSDWQPVAPASQPGEPAPPADQSETPDDTSH